MPTNKKGREYEIHHYRDHPICKFSDEDFFRTETSIGFVEAGTKENAEKDIDERIARDIANAIALLKKHNVALRRERNAPATVVPNKKNADPEHERWLDDILTLKEAASVRKVSIDTLRSEIQKGNLQVVRRSARLRGMTRREAMKSIRLSPK